MPKRILQGIVVDDAKNKTVKVLVQRKVKHPVYGKYVTSSKSYLAHDEENMSLKGAKIEIQECRPVSKRKSWQVITENRG